MQLFGINSGLSTLLLLAFALFALSASALPQPQDNEGGDGVEGVEEFGDDGGSDDVSSSAVKGKKWNFRPFRERRRVLQNPFQCAVPQGGDTGKEVRGCRNIGFSLDPQINGFNWDGDGAFKLCIWKDKSCKQSPKGIVKKQDCAGKGKGGTAKGQAYSIIKASKKC